MRLRQVFNVGVLMFTPCLLLLFGYVNFHSTCFYFCETEVHNSRQMFSRDVGDNARFIVDNSGSVASSQKYRDGVLNLHDEVRSDVGESDRSRDSEVKRKAINVEDSIPNKFRPQWWKNHTQTICKMLGMSTDRSRVPVDQLAKVLVDDKHKLLFCQIAKVASTNLGKIFAIITGLFNGTNPNLIPPPEIHSKYNNLHVHLSSLPLKEILKRIKTYFKFVFVRDPFERLLSAYRNKFLKPPNSSFEYLSRKMVKIYRTNSTLRGGVTFEEFIKYLVDPAKIIPTNSHWQPYYELCRPCEMMYDFVGKLSTFNEDTRYVLEVNKLDKLVEFPKMPNSAHTLHKTDTMLSSYYSQIPKELLQQLYKMYFPDYVLFDFTLPPEIKELMQ